MHCQAQAWCREAQLGNCIAKRCVGAVMFSSVTVMQSSAKSWQSAVQQCAASAKRSAATHGDGNVKFGKALASQCTVPYGRVTVVRGIVPSSIGNAVFCTVLVKLSCVMLSTGLALFSRAQ